MNKFSKGDRVKIIHPRSFLGEYITAKAWEGRTGIICRNDAFNTNIYGVNTSNRNVETANPSDWCWFHADDLILEGDAKVARRTFKLVKETPELRKGTIFQEACDDGTQEYIVIDLSSSKDKSGRGTSYLIYDRSLVEEQPQWFVEVFQVEPQYMTREELDRWEAFKAGRPAKVKATLKTDIETTPVKKPTMVLSDERIAQFVKAYNSSRSTKAVAEKLKIARGSVSAYKSIALKHGHTLKTMKRAKVARKVA